MSALSIPAPFPIFSDTTGAPLDGGYIYIGAANQDPVTNPIAAYWDAALTIPAVQPIRTSGGYPVYNGSPTNIYVNTDYSIRVNNSNGVFVYSAPTATARLSGIVLTGVDSANVSYLPAGTGAVATNVQDKLRESVSILDYNNLTTAFSALGGVEGTGYNTAPVELDLLGQSISFTGTLFVPTNVSLVNGTINGIGTHKLVFRNPFLANTALRPYTEYWQYMKSKNKNVYFNCLVVNNVFIGLVFDNCKFNGANSGLVHVNSNGLWTEYTSYEGFCSFAANAATGCAILFDGNISGTSTYSSGTGPGTPDGSFGYTSFGASCTIDSTAPMTGITVKDGATLYGSNIAFRGYARGAGPSGAFMYIDSSVNVSSVNQSNFNIHLESFGTAANVLSISENSRFWYNVGTIQSASPEMVMAQANADLRSNSIDVIGVVLGDSNGVAVFNGSSYMTKLTTHAVKRVWSVPAFSSYPTVNQAFSSNVVSKIELAGEDFDTNADFASSRFTPRVAGYYQINAQIKISATVTAAACTGHIYKNGVPYRTNDYGLLGASMIRSISTVVYLDGVDDYIELYVYVFDNGGSPQWVSGAANTFMDGCLVRVA